MLVSIFIQFKLTRDLVVLPFADMTLLAANTATGIIVSVLLSIFCLGEIFIWKFDMTALLFIISGSVMIVSLSNTKETSFDS